MTSPARFLSRSQIRIISAIILCGGAERWSAPKMQQCQRFQTGIGDVSCLPE